MFIRTLFLLIAMQRYVEIPYLQTFPVKKIK